jgi:hypothetical protein
MVSGVWVIVARIPWPLEPPAIWISFWSTEPSATMILPV